VCEDIQTVFAKDPAARTAFEVLTCYPGLHAVWLHRVAHSLWRRNHPTLARLLSLKEELEPGSEGLYGAFRPGADGEPVPRAIDYGALGREPSPWDAILLCVGADPRSGNDLDRLEAEVRRRLEACARALRG
jgi:hypothetical protein